MSSLSRGEVVDFMDEAYSRGIVSYGGLRYKECVESYVCEDFSFMGRNEKLQGLCNELCHWLHLVSKEPYEHLKELFLQNKNSIEFLLHPYTTPFALSEVDWETFELLGCGVADGFGIDLKNYSSRATSKEDMCYSDLGFLMFELWLNQDDHDPVMAAVCCTN